MTKLNKAQLEQLEDLKEVISDEYANLMLKHTHFVSNEQLEEFYNEAMELEGDFVHTNYDANFYSVASDYAEIDKDTFEQAFSLYGEYTLYMDEYGQGLVIGCF